MKRPPDRPLCDVTYRFLKIPIAGHQSKPGDVQSLNAWLKDSVQAGERVIAMTATAEFVLLLVEAAA